MRRSFHSAQRGFALLLVMVIGTVALYAATGLIGDGSVNEREAQERELLKLRAYWAGMGHITYAISRSRQGLPCGTECKEMIDREDFFLGALAELNDFEKGVFKCLGAGRDRHWAYPEISPNYFLPLYLHAELNAAETRIELRVHYQDFEPGGKNAVPIDHPFIANNWHIRDGFAAILCVGLAYFDAPCASNPNGMRKNGSLARVTRLEPR
jgi:hypothetical protein